MRIVLVTAAPPEVHCGIGDYTAKLANALADLGEDVTVVRGASPRPQMAGPTGSARVRPVVTSWSVLQLTAIRRVVLEQRPDLVHVQFPGRGFGRSFAPNLLPWILRGRHRPALVTTVHEYGIATWRGRIRILIGALGSDALVYPDEVVAAQVEAAVARLSSATTRVIPPAANLPTAPSDLDRTGVRARFGLTEDALTVGWFGLLTRDKGADVLLRALEAVRASRRVVLVLIGDVGDQRDARELMAAINELGLMTVSTGPLSDLDASAAIASMDVIALPYSRGVTTRRTSYLAVGAQGTYAVTTDFRRRGYEPEANTTFVAPGDVPALTAAILEADHRPRRRGRSVSWVQIAEAHRDLYRLVGANRHKQH